MLLLTLSILIFPLSNALLCLVGGRKFTFLDKYSFLSLIASFILSLFLSYEIWGKHQILQTSFHWISFQNLRLSIGFQIDKLSSLLINLVTFIASLVHLFSLEYMHNDKYYYRYWGYLGLFCAAMLGIIMSNNLLMLFIFWELVGVSSYFLIGFWFQKDKPARASQKAFIVNRIGDVGFLCGILWLFAYTHNLDLQNLATFSSQIPAEYQTAISLLIFGGAIGKSAQFPLQIWLPDAMEGPTPVSSLIHAATMVAAGVYLTARIYILFSPEALEIIAFIGGITALMAAIAAFTQNDIKRVLAYSTVSQLGLMILGLGVGGYESALFHLITHAFFKCGLFLVAAIVIHEVQHQLDNHKIENISAQDIRYMGGLKNAMPITFYAYLACMFGLIGMPFFSGFLSKEGILQAAFQFSTEKGGIFWAVASMALLTSLFTAFYMTRHLVLIFLGENRLAKQFSNYHFHFHEANWRMYVPVSITALLSFFVFYSFNPFSGENSWLLAAFVSPRIATHSAHFPHFITLLSSLTVLILGAGGAYYYYKVKENTPSLADNSQLIYQLSFQHFYQDKLYTQLIAQPFLFICKILYTFDKQIIDGVVNFIGNHVASQPHQARKNIKAAHDVPSSLAEWANLADRVVLDKSFDAIAASIQSPKKGKKSLAYWASMADKHVIDGAVNGIASSVQSISKSIKRMQNGNTQNYMLLGALGFMLLLGAIVGGVFYLKGKNQVNTQNIVVNQVDTTKVSGRMGALLLQVVNDDTAFFHLKTPILDGYDLLLAKRFGAEKNIVINKALQPEHQVDTTAWAEFQQSLTTSTFQIGNFKQYQFLPSMAVQQLAQKYNLGNETEYQKYWEDFSTNYKTNVYNSFGVPLFYQHGKLALVTFAKYTKAKTESKILLYQYQNDGTWHKLNEVGQAY